MCSPTVSGLGFSGGVWVDSELGFWSRRGGGAVGLGFGVGSSSRGSPVCRGFVVGLGLFVVGLPWVLGEHSEEENKNEEREKRNEEREKKS